MSLLTTFKQHARQLKTETLALYLAARDPRTPWYAKLLAAAIVGFAFSPIDLIPDFIPVLGYLDDLILIPIGITLAIKLIPEPILADCRLQAQEKFEIGKPVSRIAAVVIVLFWIAVVLLSLWITYQAVIQPTPSP